MLKRAYSLLHVKSVDGEKRIITGTATTPTPDRMGDIVEPLGVLYRNPLPLLLYHNSQKPVGWVKFGKPTKDGIDFQAQLPMIDEPGTVRDRIEEAWTSIKSGLLAGVSIGFRAIEEAFNKETNGYRFLKTEVLELSLVAIPAHPDATIHTIKSLDVGLAATGTEAARPIHSSGVSDPTRVVQMRPERHMKKSYSEQIASWEATLASKTARMDEIMEKANDDGVTLDVAQQDEHDGLVTEVRDINAHITRLKDSESRAKASAVPIDGSTAAAAAASRGAHVISVRENIEPGIKMARMVMCKAFAELHRVNVVEVAKARYPHDVDMHLYLKTAVAAGTPTDATWASPLVQQTNFGNEFIEYLRPKTIIGQFGQNGIPSLHRVPFNIRVPTQTSGGSASWVGAGKPKPLTKFDFDAVTLLWSKLAAISVLTQELIRFSSPSAEALVRDGLAKAIVAKMDTDFVDPAKAAVTNVSPASITNGITPHVASGVTAAALQTDLATLMGDFNTAEVSLESGVIIMSGATAIAISIMQNSLGQAQFPTMTRRGGTLLGFPVIVSNYLATGSSPSTTLLIMVNADDIFLADDGNVTIDASREASLQMDDTPTNDATTGTGQVSVSMFQTNSVAIRAEREVNWQRVRAAAVAYISNAAYTG